MDILDMCRQGSYLLYKLEIEIERQELQTEKLMEFLEIVHTMQKQIQDFSEYVPIIMIILDSKFYQNQEYPRRLMDAIYQNKQSVV